MKYPLHQSLSQLQKQWVVTWYLFLLKWNRSPAIPDSVALQSTQKAFADLAGAQKANETSSLLQFTFLEEPKPEVDEFPSSFWREKQKLFN